jgi:hypothetical protein
MREVNYLEYSKDEALRMFYHHQREPFILVKISTKRLGK